MHYQILGDPIFREREIPACSSSLLHERKAMSAFPTSWPITRPGAEPGSSFASFRIDPLPRVLGRSYQPASTQGRMGRCRCWTHRRLWRAADRVRVSRESIVDLGDVAIVPGLVNAHTHLELSYLRNRVPGGSSFVNWIREVMSARRGYPDPRAPEILDSIDRGIAEATRCGTAVVGDISNTLVPFEPLVRSSLAGVVFYELIGFKTPDPVEVVDRARQTIEGLSPTDRIRPSLAAHAPYSVAPLIFQEIQRAVNRAPGAPCSVHLAESKEELEFISKRPRRMARVARRGWRLGSGLGGAGHESGSIP